jgi:ribokinase
VGRVVVVGSVNSDYVVRIDHLPQPGETVAGGQLAVRLGGKGANQAHAAARLGASVTLIAAVGRDKAAYDERASLQLDGIDASGLVDCEGPSGVAVVLVDGDGENMIVVAPGANSMLSPGVVDARLHGLVDAQAVVLASLEVPLDAVAAAAAAAARAGAIMMINPAPAMALPTELLRNVVLTPNEGEVLRVIEGAVDESAAVAAMLAAGAMAVIVTRGSRGATIFQAGAMSVDVPAPIVDVVDTVGAGDAFNGAMAAALADGLLLRAAVGRAVAAGAAACRGVGARAALPLAADVAALLSSEGSA